ncbi:dTDP-4-dehydrorhamnose 3,5-epimerase [Fusobacterium necrophorum]|nr:dTDP-4-dehydrorhamnose 3,5-epimerase family protein [Fusobacterium necrophorum]AZW08936.1 hypothetical protein EO219_04640 [Fusobacterium necrophorum subsp. necrophorum]SDB49843.1 dTDP-4-dehydrorhamnose 3,5-epimerase [Fusobacterium necrophorum]SQC98639.1 dTDP-4-dehydrorhamnose 3,5-epimerase [Fusobacterium necrophorum subsp. necrophorum]SQC98645.1 dTDP-4-dehydrorhamnose 3,5-epimerase [Fusobacterium necrophorum subsp. necrophorum]SQC98879.1 dTDP-4-dehydrorhamnose 3,5-epimerase [Fusobacterium 
MSCLQKIETRIQGLFLIKCSSFPDQRGSFSELYREKIFREFGILKSFIQRK